MSEDHDIAENSDTDSYRSIRTEESWHCGCCYDPYPIQIFMERDHNFIDEYETRKKQGMTSHKCIEKGKKRSQKKIKKSKSKKNGTCAVEACGQSDTDTSSEIVPSRGDFSFITDYKTRIMFQDAYDAITKASAWEFVERDPREGEFMFSSDPMSSAIQKEMKYDDHSRASYEITMRKMQRLARIGWDTFIKEDHAI
jgi:hypothetical protein